MQKLTAGKSLVGIGLYTPGEAQRLIGVPGGKLVRWLKGHEVAGRSYEPLWAGEIAADIDQVVLSFQDLVQARLAAALIAHKLSPQKVRKAIRLAADILGTEHPFASARFRTDGKTLLLESLTEREDWAYIDLFSGGQYVMREIIEPSLKGVEFDSDSASRWWPHGRKAGIVLDPQRQFGQPIEAQSGVPTRVLSNAIVAQGSAEAAARAFSVPVRAVRRAADFERRLAA